MRFSQKVVLVTGAASGIGATTARRFRDEGALVIGIDRVAADDVTRCDVTDEPGVERVVAQTIATHGRLDVVCNVAGILRRGPFEALTLDTWNEVIASNLTGPFLVSRAALPHLVESAGNIVNVASISGLHGQTHTAAYCASKGGLVQLTRALAVEVADRSVRVNCVCPGGVDTPLVADRSTSRDVPRDAPALRRTLPLMPGLSDPTEVAAAITYLASDDARSITGAALVIDRGTLVS
jgi:NAD(P)-dependent dehydrogenase (short-subunit alcohol dehydrogenase family)